MKADKQRAKTLKKCIPIAAVIFSEQEIKKALCIIVLN
jgi:hypothetical protein